MLKILTGKSTQQHIHDKIIEKAKEKLSTTNHTVGEIAYMLGFEHHPVVQQIIQDKNKLHPIRVPAGFN